MPNPSLQKLAAFGAFMGRRARLESLTPKTIKIRPGSRSFNREQENARRRRQRAAALLEMDFWPED